MKSRTLHASRLTNPLLFLYIALTFLRLRSFSIPVETDVAPDEGEGETLYCPPEITTLYSVSARAEPLFLDAKKRCVCVFLRQTRNTCSRRVMKSWKMFVSSLHTYAKALLFCCRLQYLIPLWSNKIVFPCYLMLNCVWSHSLVLLSLLTPSHESPLTCVTTDSYGGFFFCIH